MSAPSQDRDVFSFLGEIAESKQGNQHACLSSLMFPQRAVLLRCALEFYSCFESSQLIGSTCFLDGGPKLQRSEVSGPASPSQLVGDPPSLDPEPSGMFALTTQCREIASIFSRCFISNLGRVN